MSATNQNDRTPKDLSVPETMKIAALLAELMPPGATGGMSAPVSLATDAADPLDDGQNPDLGPPSLQIEDLDEELSLPAPVMMPSAAVRPSILPQVPRITATVLPASSPALRPSVPPVEAVAPTRLSPAPVPPPLPAPGDSAVDDSLDGYDRTSKPDDGKRSPAEPPSPAAAHDPELIPLGNLSAAGYFSLVNWKNDPERVRHPRRADYGLDEQTLAQARRNPFYVIGKPRQPESRNVAEVLAEIAWE